MTNRVIARLMVFVCEGCVMLCDDVFSVLSVFVFDEGGCEVIYV